MKTLLFFVITVVAVFSITGCIEPYSAGVGSGIAVMDKLSSNAQDKFITAILEINKKTDEFKAALAETEGTMFIKPETLDAARGINARAKDPVTWVALVSMLANAFVGGNKFGSRGV